MCSYIHFLICYCNTFILSPDNIKIYSLIKRKSEARMVLSLKSMMPNCFIIHVFVTSCTVYVHLHNNVNGIENMTLMSGIDEFTFLFGMQRNPRISTG